MFKIYNSKAISRTERFNNALIMGTLACGVCILVTVVLYKVFNIFFPLLYLGYGVLIGYAIQYFGKGVHIQFSILGAILALVAIVISDLILCGFDMEVLRYEFFDSIYVLAYHVGGVYLGFATARLIG